MRDFIETVNYRITEGSDYLWECYGHNSYSLDSWNGDNEYGHSASIVFDLKTQVVYEMDVSDYKNNRAYRWIHPDYRKSFNNEATDRGVELNEAWDTVKYIDLETTDDMLDKARAIVDGVEYDTRVQVPLELENNTIVTMALEAHKLDITLNDYIERILRNVLDTKKKN